MSISASDVKSLRELTGAGMMDCKKALQEASGNVEKAVEILRKKGLKNVSKRSGKVAAEGYVGSYLHANGQIASMVELNCETDFVARGEDFRELARNIAMHVSAMNPLYLNEEEVPAEVIEKETSIILESLNDNQKDKADKIIPGKINKFYQENCLLKQAYIKDDSGKKTISQVIDDLSAKVGEKVKIRRFIRIEVGEGIEKEAVDLAADVQATIAAL